MKNFHKRGGGGVSPFHKYKMGGGHHFVKVFMISLYIITTCLAVFVLRCCPVGYVVNVCHWNISTLQFLNHQLLKRMHWQSVVFGPVWYLSFREHLTGEKSISFGLCPKRGGGEPCPNLLTLSSAMLSLMFWHQYHVMWYLVIFNTKIIKSTKIIITIITLIIVIIIVNCFCNL